MICWTKWQFIDSLRSHNAHTKSHNRGFSCDKGWFGEILYSVYLVKREFLVRFLGQVYIVPHCSKKQNLGQITIQGYWKFSMQFQHYSKSCKIWEVFIFFKLSYTLSLSLPVLYKESGFEKKFSTYFIWIYLFLQDTEVYYSARLVSINGCHYYASRSS